MEILEMKLQIINVSVTFVFLSSGGIILRYSCTLTFHVLSNLWLNYLSVVPDLCEGGLGPSPDTTSM